jgi:uncharacterized delta-60 repeat protein
VGAHPEVFVRSDRLMARLALAAAAGVLALGVAGVPAAHAAGTGGSIDTSFGNQGTAITDLGVDAAGNPRLGTPSAVALLPNGDLLVGGELGVVRLLPTGALDTSFGSAGYAPAGFPVGGSELPGLAVQPDGKILWLGGTSIPNPPAGTDSTNFAVERFNANGTPDTTFGHGGVATTDIPNDNLGLEEAQTAVVQPDGKIVVGGFVSVSGRRGHDDAALVRYDSNGSLDSSFGSGGMVVSDPGNVRAIALDAAGDIFVVPTETEFSPAGHKDARVSASPITTSTPSALGPGVSVPDGAFVFLPTGQTLSGSSVTNPNDIKDIDAQVQRLNADGSIDPTFASPPIDFNGQEGGRSSLSVDSLAVQPDGKILIGGGPGLARVNADGTLDTTFANGGAEPGVGSTLPVFLPTSALQVVLPHAKFLAIGAASNSTTAALELTLTPYFQNHPSKKAERLAGMPRQQGNSATRQLQCRLSRVSAGRNGKER